MATLIPDRSQRIFYETDMRPPVGLRPNDAYNIALYMERGKKSRGVLVVHTALQLLFRDGKSTQPGTKGNKLTWLESQKREFTGQFKGALHQAWNDKHRITTTSRYPVVTDIGVLFSFHIMIDGWHLSDHWELTVEKADGFRGSSVTPFLGNSALDSHDVKPVVKSAGHKQRGAVHEFGPMLGLRDEYPAARDNKHWRGDVASVMYSGETIRERHYAMFAAWITQQYAHMARLAKSPIIFKVNGRVDLSNAKL